MKRGSNGRFASKKPAKKPAHRFQTKLNREQNSNMKKTKQHDKTKEVDSFFIRIENMHGVMSAASLKLMTERVATTSPAHNIGKANGKKKGGRHMSDDIPLLLSSENRNILYARHCGEVSGNTVVIKNDPTNPPIRQMQHLDGQTSFIMPTSIDGACLLLLATDKDRLVEYKIHLPQYIMIIFNGFHAGAEGLVGSRSDRIHGYLGTVPDERSFKHRTLLDMLIKETTEHMPAKLSCTFENLLQSVPQVKSIDAMLKKAMGLETGLLGVIVTEWSLDNDSGDIMETPVVET